jgi:hypothetical protein
MRYGGLHLRYLLDSRPTCYAEPWVDWLRCKRQRYLRQPSTFCTIQRFLKRRRELRGDGGTFLVPSCAIIASSSTLQSPGVLKLIFPTLTECSSYRLIEFSNNHRNTLPSLLNAIEPPSFQPGPTLHHVPPHLLQRITQAMSLTSNHSHSTDTH